ncbi:LURP-one-related family protein [Senegalia massiliensis]|uniref:LURP-one-related family protein n=1 Tax=Senegalia massiliensis TaxID=1720316 RepID=UPI00102F6B6C|nr:LURP-one-related family protein [Senegalia massiliensis]
MKFKIEKNIPNKSTHITIKNSEQELLYDIVKANYFNDNIFTFFDEKEKEILTINIQDTANNQKFNIYKKESLIGEILYDRILFRHNFIINKDKKRYRLEGDPSSMEFEIWDNDKKIANISKRAILLSEAYEVDTILLNDELLFIFGVITTIDFILFDIGN